MNPIDLLDDAFKLLSKLDPEIIKLAVKLINTLVSSEDPAESIKRATLAAVAKKSYRRS